MISKKLFKFNHPNTVQFIVFLLIATLPYFSLRKLTYGISPTLVLFVIICILAACKIFIKGKIPNFKITKTNSWILKITKHTSFANKIIKKFRRDGV